MSEARPGDQSTAAALHLHPCCSHQSAEHAQSATRPTTCWSRQQQQQQQQQQRQAHSNRSLINVSSHPIFLLPAMLLLAGTATAQYLETKVYADGACRQLTSTSIIDGAYGKNTSRVVYRAVFRPGARIEIRSILFWRSVCWPTGLLGGTQEVPGVVGIPVPIPFYNGSSSKRFHRAKKWQTGYELLGALP